jgi:hypothetical protein
VSQFGNFSVFDAIEVVDARGYAPEGSLRNDEYEISFAKYFVNIVVNDSLPLRGESVQSCEEAWNGIGNPGIVLDILRSVEVGGKGFSPAAKEVVHVTLHQGLVCLGLVKLRGDCGAIDHAMPAGAGLGGGLLQVVPVLDDQALFKAKDVEADLRAEEIVLRVGKDKVAILKDADRVDLCSGRQAAPISATSSSLL